MKIEIPSPGPPKDGPPSPALGRGRLSPPSGNVPGYGDCCELMELSTQARSGLSNQHLRDLLIVHS